MHKILKLFKMKKCNVCGKRIEKGIEAYGKVFCGMADKRKYEKSENVKPQKGKVCEYC